DQRAHRVLHADDLVVDREDVLPPERQLMPAVRVIAVAALPCAVAIGVRRLCAHGRILARATERFFRPGPSRAPSGAREWRAACCRRRELRPPRARAHSRSPTWRNRPESPPARP